MANRECKSLSTSNHYSSIMAKSKMKVEEKRREVITSLDKQFEELDEKDREKLSEPAYFVTVESTINRSICTNIPEKKQMLEDILIQKIKFTGNEELALNFDKASAAAYELSFHEIQLLVLIDTYSCILCSIVNGTGAITDSDKICDYLEGVSKFSIEEIKKCEKLFLIYDRTQYEHDLSTLFEYKAKNEQIHRLISLIEKIAKDHYDINLREGIITSSNDINLSVYNLSTIGKIISRCQIKSLGMNCIADDIFPLKLSNVIANNIIGLGAVTAKANALS